MDSYAEKLREDLEREEGRVKHAYQDSKGIWTCGIGFNIDRDHGGEIPDLVMDFWLTVKLQQIEEALDKHLTWWRSRPEPTQRALCNACYQLGINGLLKFKRMLAALHAGDYNTAAAEALDSDWYTQTPGRVERISELFRESNKTPLAPV